MTARNNHLRMLSRLKWCAHDAESLTNGSQGPRRRHIRTISDFDASNQMKMARWLVRHGCVHSWANTFGTPFSFDHTNSGSEFTLLLERWSF
jgi:hypothetical protein